MRAHRTSSSIVTSFKFELLRDDVTRRDLVRNMAAATQRAVEPRVDQQRVHRVLLSQDRSTCGKAPSLPRSHRRLLPYPCINYCDDRGRHSAFSEFYHWNTAEFLIHGAWKLSWILSRRLHLPRRRAEHVV